MAITQVMLVVPAALPLTTEQKLDLPAHVVEHGDLDGGSIETVGKKALMVLSFPLGMVEWPRER